MDAVKKAVMDRGAVITAYRRWAPVYDQTFGTVAAAGRRHAVVGRRACLAPPPVRPGSHANEQDNVLHGHLRHGGGRYRAIALPEEADCP